MPKSIVIQFSGELDNTNIEEQGAAIQKLIAEHGVGLTLVLDFKDLEYLNSTAIGNLMQWYLQVKEAEGNLVIAQPNENVADILEVVGLTSRIKMFPTIEEAVASADSTIKADQSSEPIAANPAEDIAPVPQQNDAPIEV